MNYVCIGIGALCFLCIDHWSRRPVETSAKPRGHALGRQHSWVGIRPCSQVMQTTRDAGDIDNAEVIQGQRAVAHLVFHVPHPTFHVPILIFHSPQFHVDMFSTKPSCGQNSSLAFGTRQELQDNTVMNSKKYRVSASRPVFSPGAVFSVCSEIAKQDLFFFFSFFSRASDE